MEFPNELSNASQLGLVSILVAAISSVIIPTINYIRESKLRPVVAKINGTKTAAMLRFLIDAAADSELSPLEREVVTEALLQKLNIKPETQENAKPTEAIEEALVVTNSPD